MGPKLYYHPLSTFSRRVRIVFAEKQIPHELSLVDKTARRPATFERDHALSVPALFGV
jgi:glutathione S-transferase